MSLYSGKQRAFANFINQLSALKEDTRKILVVAHGAARWASKKGTPAPSTRAYKECTHRFVTILVDDFQTTCMHHELGCTLQRVEMEKCQRSPEDVEKYGALTEQQTERGAHFRRLLALVSKTN